MPKGTSIPDPIICHNCKECQKQVKRWLKKLNTGNKDLDEYMQNEIILLIPPLIHRFYDLPPPDPSEKYIH